MGDPAVAEALKIGVSSIVEVMGETVVFERIGRARRDPLHPSRRMAGTAVKTDIMATVADVRDDLIDEVLVKSGDKSVTFVAGLGFVPVIGDTVIDGAGRRFTVLRIATNRIAGIDTSYEVLVR